MERSATLEQVEEAAAAWLLRRESPQWCADDEAALGAWLRAATTHRVSYMRLRSVWKQARRLKVAGAALASDEMPQRGAISRSPFFAGRRWKVALRTPLPRQSEPRPGKAASAHGAREADSTGTAGPASPEQSGIPMALKVGMAAGVGVVALLAGTLHLSRAEEAEFRTPVGGMASVPMADGSRIMLNSDSEIELEISHRERRVNLLRGEAFFDVARDPGRPFVVYANHDRVVAVGTQFSVRLKSDTVQVVVTEGRVRVEKARLVGRSRPVASLEAGNVASSGLDRVRIDRVPVPEAERTLSWRTGHILLRKTRLADAVAEFNRYNLRQIVIEDPALERIEVGGNFESANVDGFVRLLQAGFPIRAEERGARITLSRRPL